MDSHDEGLVVLSVRESRQTKKARDVRGCWIAAILRSQSTQQRFRLARVEALDAPHDLVFSGRSVENEIGRRHVPRRADSLDRSACFLADVPIGVQNLPVLLLST